MTEFLSVVVSAAPLFATSDGTGGLETEVLYGESVRLIQESDHHVRVTTVTDDYTGWLDRRCLGEKTSPTHRVSKPGTIATEAADVKSKTAMVLSMGAQVRVVGTERGIAEIDLGSGRAYVPHPHITELSVTCPDWVSVAHSFIGVPYRWGGRTSAGLDCSALVQLALQAGGVSAPRNSSDQQQMPGQDIHPDSERQRGDLVFWRGHVGVMLNGEDLLHANACHREVSIEPLQIVADRAVGLEGSISAVKRVAL